MNRKTNKFKTIFDLRYLFYDFVKVTGVFPVMLYLRLKKYYYKEKDKTLFKEPVIVISNHITYSDIIVLLATFWNKRVSFIAKKELFKGIGNLFFKGVKAIPVQNKNIQIITLKKAQKELERGHMVALFPEGHIKTQEGIDKFKPGAVLLALMCNVPIVQLYIQEKKHWWERQKVMIGKKYNITEMLGSENPTLEQINELTNMLYEEEINLARAMEEKVRS